MHFTAYYREMLLFSYKVHYTARQLLRIVMLLDDVCFVLHVTPLYPTFLFSLLLSFVLIVLINYITR